MCTFCGCIRVRLWQRHLLLLLFTFFVAAVVVVRSRHFAHSRKLCVFTVCCADVKANEINFNMFAVGINYQQNAKQWKSIMLEIFFLFIFNCATNAHRWQKVFVTILNWNAWHIFGYLCNEVNSNNIQLQIEIK